MAVGVFLWRVTQKTGGRGTSFPHRGVFLQPFQIAVLISLCINVLTGSKNNTNRQNGKCAFAGTSTQGLFKNGSRRRKEADFGSKNTSASLPQP